MEYNKFELWLSENLLEFHKFDSLGGKATFKAKYNRQDGSLTLRINKRRGGFTEKLLKKTDIVRIFERWGNASPSDKKKSSYFQIQNWPDSPGMVETPAIPAIINFWNNLGKI